MAYRGVHFAITHEEVAQLRSLHDESNRLDWLQEEIEEKYFSELPEFKAESDKAWDALHRLLGDGDLTYDSGPEPLRFLLFFPDWALGVHARLRNGTPTVQQLISMTYRPGTPWGETAASEAARAPLVQIMGY